MVVQFAARYVLGTRDLGACEALFMRAAIIVLAVGATFGTGCSCAARRPRRGFLYPW